MTENKKNGAGARVVFFVTLPREQKGLTGAVVCTRTVIDVLTADARAEVEIVERRHTRIRTTRRVVTPGALLAYLRDYAASLAALGRALGRHGTPPTTLYLSAASSLGGTLRDVGAILVARPWRTGTRVVLHSHNGDFFHPNDALLRVLRKWELARADRTICLSRRLLPEAAELARLMPGGRQERISVVPNTIDEALVVSEREIAAKAARSAPITVLYLSNFIPSKGFLLLAEAIRRIERAGRLDGFRFVFRGNWPDPAMKTVLEETLGEAALTSGAVEIGAGIWDRDEVRETLLAADVFCLPTSYPSEAQPLSIIEAMACGCAILATDHASIADMVIPDENGALVEKGSAEAIAAFLLRTDRATLSRQGAASRALFGARFARDRFDAAIREAVL